VSDQASSAPVEPAASPPTSGAPAVPQQQPPRPPDTRGHSPALDAREQMAAPNAERRISVAGKEYDEADVSNALAERIERQLAREALPSSPDRYEAKLPANFKPPAGYEFQLDASDPALREFQALAHRRGLDQDTFEEALGVFATTRMAELEHVNHARQVEVEKLGAAAHQRLDAIETWLKSRVGDKANVLTATLKQYPVAATVETFETLMRAFSAQGSSAVTGGGREGQPDPGDIPGFENMNFVQRRAAQMSLLMSRNSGGGKR
jgi:hypothetical protein